MQLHGGREQAGTEGSTAGSGLFPGQRMARVRGKLREVADQGEESRGGRAGGLQHLRRPGRQDPRGADRAGDGRGVPEPGGTGGEGTGTGSGTGAGSADGHAGSGDGRAAVLMLAKVSKT